MANGGTGAANAPDRNTRETERLKMKAVYSEKKKVWQVFTFGVTGTPMLEGEFKTRREAVAFIVQKNRAPRLRLQLQKILNKLLLTSTNAEADRLRQTFNAEVRSNPWANVEIHANKVTVTEK